MKRAILFILAVAILAGGVQWARIPVTGTVVGTELTGSGIIQARQDVVISAEVGGHVIALEADEGDEVEAGTVLARLDEALLLAQIAQADAAVEATEANLASVKASASAPEIEAGKAAVDGAKAQVAAAQTAVDTARANLRAAQARHRAAQAEYSRLTAGASEWELEIARQQTELAKTQSWRAQAQRDATKGGVNMPLAIRLTIGDFQLDPIIVDNPAAPEQFDVDAAEAAVLQAESSTTIAELQYDRLKAGPRSQDLAVMQAQLVGAQADVEIAQVELKRAQQAVAAAEAQLQQSEAQLELTLADARPEAIAVAEAKVAQARAEVAILEVQRDNLSLRTPIAGLVTERTVHEGEIVVRGARLFTISSLDPVILTVYIPEDQIGRVRIGQAADVHVDAYPGRTFRGEVIHIASRAEFTPKNVQTKAARVTTVFAVKIRIPNPDHLLTPGMPADAILQ